MSKKLKELGKLIQNYNKENTPEQMFKDAYRDVVKRENQRGRKPSKTYTPSSIGGCIREVYFKRIGQPVDKDSGVEAEVSEMGDSGEDRHKRIQRHIIKMKEYGHDIEWIDVAEYLNKRPVEGTIIKRKANNKNPEAKLYSELFNIMMMCDGIVKINGVYYILEIKTEISYKFQSRTEIASEHIPQASTYSLVTGVPRILFVYESRDKCEKRVFSYGISEENRNIIKEKINTIEWYIENGKIPDKEETKKNCRYCNYKGSCNLY